MVCPNCGSNEVIAVQGENFCISCGQLVTKGAAASSLPISTDGLPAGVTIMPLPGDEPLPAKPKRKAAGRPKAGALDAPAEITARIVAEEPAAAPEPVPAASFQDITPPPPPKRPKLPPLLEGMTLAYGAVLRSSLTDRYSHGRAALAAFPAALAVIILTATGLVIASNEPHLLISGTKAGSLAVGGELAIIAVLYYLIRSLTHAAIIFGTARLADHRPLAGNRWLEAAADSQGRRIALDTITGLALLSAVCLGGALVLSGGQNLPVPQAVQIGILMIGFAALLYMAVALVMTVSLAHVAVTLGRVHVWSSLKLGWRLFRHHFELAGARLIALAIEAVALIAVIVGAGGWLVITPAGLRPIVIIGLAVVATALGGLAGAGTAIWWTATYRMLVRVDHPAGFNRLLSTQTPKAGRRGAVVTAGLSVVVLAALAAAWPLVIH